MKIGILGTGAVATGLGGHLSDKGHSVVYGSRASGQGAVSQLDAVTQSELVITAIPGAAVLDTIETIGEDAFAGKIVLDLAAPISSEGTLLFPNDSLARRVQERLPSTRVVKTLNTMNVSMMIDPSVQNPTVFVSGDDAGAKDAVKGLLGDLGWSDGQILDLGGIETAVGTEHACYLFFATFTALQSPAFTISIAR